MPGSVPKVVLYAIGGFMEFSAKLSGKAPELTTKEIAMFSGLQQDFDISKSRNELGFNPKKPERIVKEALEYLMLNKHLL